MVKKLNIMRIFLGIKTNEEVTEKIVKALRPLKKIPSDLKWVKEKNIHLTLKFIGEVEISKAGRILDLFNKKIGIPPFYAEISGFGKFGRDRDLNVLWAGVSPVQELTKLFEEIELCLENAGVERETREFRPHITLARNRKRNVPSKLLRSLEEMSDIFISKYKIDSFQIFSSELFPDGPKYKILKNIIL